MMTPDLPLELKIALARLWELLTTVVSRQQEQTPGPPPGGVLSGGMAVTAQDVLSRAPVIPDVDHESGEVESRLSQLERAFGLTELEAMCLLLALAPEYEPGFCRLYGMAQNHFGRQHATLSLLLDLLPLQRAAVRRLLDPNGPLIRWSLIEVDDPAPGTPRAHVAFRAATPVLRFLEGADVLDSALAPFVTPLHSARRCKRKLIGGGTAFEDLARELLFDERPGLLFKGAPGSGKTRWAAELLLAIDRQGLLIDLDRIVAEDAPAELLHQALVEATMTQCVPVIRCNQDVPWIRSSLRCWDDLIIVLSSADINTAPLEEGRNLRIVEIPELDTPTRARIWDRFLPERLRTADLSPSALAARYTLSPGRVESAVAGATRTLAPGERVTQALLDRAIQAQTSHQLGQTARSVPLNSSWDDLILNDDLHLQLQEVIARFQHRDRVLREWGMAERFGTAVGLTVLFEGPPGTGKTMSAGVIAKELGLELFQVDLSAVVSKYIGETEKNLGRVFDEAERSGAMLLFDEADSLFAKRTDVTSSNDRYANLEVNYLLQRIEQFSGVAILTTNNSHNMDDAFRRRLSLSVVFPTPSAEQRQGLWASMLTQPKLPKGPISYAALGREFELSGGLIRNAVLRAAFLAASHDGLVTQKLLEVSARIEMRKHGMIVRGEVYADLRTALKSEPATPPPNAAPN